MLLLPPAEGGGQKFINKFCNSKYLKQINKTTDLHLSLPTKSARKMILIPLYINS